MRVRIVLGLALALVGVAVALVLSQRGERLAGTSFLTQAGFTVAVPSHATVCQRDTYLADDSAAAQLTIDTRGGPLPPLSVRFSDPGGQLVASGRSAGGGRRGDVTLPFARVVDGSHAGTIACVHNAGSRRVVLGGTVVSGDGVARVGGRAVGAAVGFRYLRAGHESWWALMPVLAQRFGLGKSSVFGTWTLPLLALGLVGLWLAVVRLLLRELA